MTLLSYFIYHAHIDITLSYCIYHARIDVTLSYCIYHVRIDITLLAHSANCNNTKHLHSGASHSCRTQAQEAWF